jgi:transposase
VEADEEKRNEYAEAIKDIDPKSLIYIDESGIEMTIGKDKGWSKKGYPLHCKKKVVSIISGLVANKAIAPMVFNGSCDTELFNKWVEHFLIKELKSGQVVVMDNAAFHKSGKTKELIESVGCKLIFLPPYSPDLNPIEKFWVNMKRWIKDRISQPNQLQEIITQFFSIC